jgi:eukaryotic-like serine/threonine-protein kinase
MSTKIGHFEILSELAKSVTGTVYKANDPQSGQTVALKAIELSAFGESASALQQSLLDEAEKTKSLSNSNITPVFGAGEMEGKFCAAMEYVQGNSIATMLARKEGFSIWDLLDIGRQVCAGLDYAHSNKAYHFSLEPAKIMCGWDGTVKILSLGVSSAGKFALQISAGVPSFLHYMSPEQLRGEEVDARSNLFSLGAMFYEMVTDRKAFDSTDAPSLRQSILESTPAPPLHVNPKIHPLLSELIVKALEKDPSKRYQSGRELLDDLEKCKESKSQAATKPAQAAKGPVAQEKAKAAAQSKFVSASAPSAATRQATPPGAVRPSEAKLSAPTPAGKKSAVPATNTAPRAAAAAAGWGGQTSSKPAPKFDNPNQFDTSGVEAANDATETPSAYMSAAAEAPQVETFAPDAPKIAVDPMMAEGGPTRGGGTSFSEMTELPPLKEVYIAPPPPAPAPIQSAMPTRTMYQGAGAQEERPKIQPREVAQKAIKEIKGVPPRLLLYSIAGAVALIAIIGIAVAIHIHGLSGDDDSGAARSGAPAETSAQPDSSQSAPRNEPVAPATAAAQPVPQTSEPEAEAAQPMASATPKRSARKRVVAAAPVVVPGQIALDSTPQGAQVQIDGRSDSSWVTPFNASNLRPGAHSVTVSRQGFSSDTRSVNVASGSKSTLVVHLVQLMAMLSVTSDPAGASIYVDGKDMGKVTPAQVTVDKGTHVVLVRKMGYIDETSSAQFALGQTVSISPTLRSLGNVDSIRTVGKMKKLFGGNGGQPGQATVSIRTQPKGAQVAVNQHMLDKGSPVDAMLDPGNYVVDITLSGYAPIHKVVTVEKGSKVVVDEVMQRQ